MRRARSFQTPSFWARKNPESGETSRVSERGINNNQKTRTVDKSAHLLLYIPTPLPGELKFIGEYLADHVQLKIIILPFSWLQVYFMKYFQFLWKYFMIWFLEIYRLSRIHIESHADTFWVLNHRFQHCGNRDRECYYEGKTIVRAAHHRGAPQNPECGQRPFHVPGLQKNHHPPDCG